MSRTEKGTKPPGWEFHYPGGGGYFPKLRDPWGRRHLHKMVRRQQKAEDRRDEAE